MSVSRYVDRSDIHIRFQSHRDEWTVSYRPPTALYDTRFMQSFEDESDAFAYAYELAERFGDTTFTYAYSDGVVRRVAIPTQFTGVEVAF